MNTWIDDLSSLCSADRPVVIVTVAAIRGSAPRESGAKMIVTAEETIGTIGGGQLEHQCTRRAVRMLGKDSMPKMQTYPLGSAFGQCCGGVVDILFESIPSGMPDWLRDLAVQHNQREPATLVTHLGEHNHKFVINAGRATVHDPRPPEFVLARVQALQNSLAVAERVGDYFLEAMVVGDFNIAVFGAGHVGTEVVASLSRLDCNVRWIDNRQNFFSEAPRNTRTVETQQPALEVAAMPAGSLFLVMTHSHALDFEICDQILRRGDAAYCGLIGSRSKRRRFEKRFKQLGMQQAMIDTLVCPIGATGIAGKKPAEIAVAVAAELLQAHERVRSKRNPEYPNNVRPLKNKGP